MFLSRKASQNHIVRQRSCFTLKAQNFSIPLGKRTQLMGIVNVTPDSFSQDGLLARSASTPHAHLRYAMKLIHQGADIIDIGGESTRPGAKTVTVQEELQRVVPLVRLLAKKTTIPVSVDTSKPLVAQHAIDAGAAMINIIRGTAISQKMINVLKRSNIAVVLMHMRGTPQTMQKRIRYHNVIEEIIAELQKSVQKCLESGIKSDRIIIDPGICFCKTVEHNLLILKHLKKFSALRLPILIGTSRKSFIGKILERPDPAQRIWGTAATISSAITNGAHIIRVHDVAAMRDVADITDAIKVPEGFQHL